MPSSDHPAHQPLETVKPAQLARRLNKAEQVGADPAAKERNKDRAKEELALISELRQVKAFQWFEDACLKRKFAETRETHDAHDTPPDELQPARDRFNAVRDIYRWLNEREIEHRRLLDPNDPMIDKLRETLALQ